MLSTCPHVIGFVESRQEHVHLPANRTNANVFCRLRTLDEQYRVQTPWRRYDSHTIYFRSQYHGMEFVMCLSFTEHHQALRITYVCAKTRDLWIFYPNVKGGDSNCEQDLPTRLPVHRCTPISTGCRIAFNADDAEQDCMKFEELPPEPLNLWTHVVPNNKSFEDYLRTTMVLRYSTNPAGVAQPIVEGHNFNLRLNTQLLQRDCVVQLPAVVGMQIVMTVEHYLVKPFPEARSFCSCFRDQYGVWYVGCMDNQMYFGSLMVNGVAIVGGTCVPVKESYVVELVTNQTIAAELKYKIEFLLGTSSVLGVRPL